ncbi:MAG: J domain-containing protein [Gemmatimonadaceae bacterium]|nr:J domain-containing protein [Chitinophagaceae bacterium]
MELKDYYKILETDPSASQTDISRSFRRLAHKYHPDKNQGMAQSEAMFREIQEAYQVLRDPSAREEYNYKRWHIRSLGKHYKSSVLLPHDVLGELERLANYLAAMNVFHIDNNALSAHMRQLLNETNIAIVAEGADEELTGKIVYKAAESASVLTYPYFREIDLILRKIAGNSKTSLGLLDDIVKSKKRNHYWEKYKVAGAILLTIVLCLVIYRIST